MVYEYIYDEKGEIIEINESNFMMINSLPPLNLKLMFQNEKYINEIQVSLNSEASNQGWACVYICYIYVCNRFAAYLEENGENVDDYRDTFKGLFSRILFFAKNSKPKSQENCMKSLKEIEDFKKLKNRIKWLFFLSISDIRSICSGCYKDPSLLMEEYRNQHKVCSHEFNYANLFLVDLFDKTIFSQTDINERGSHKRFWKL